MKRRSFFFAAVATVLAPLPKRKTRMIYGSSSLVGKSFPNPYIRGYNPDYMSDRVEDWMSEIAAMGK